MIEAVGIFVLFGAAVLFSENRTMIHFSSAFRTLGLQVAIAAFALLTPIGTSALAGLGQGVQKILAYANEGIEFTLGPLADSSNGFILAFQVLPVIIFIASIFGVLFYLRIMNVIIHFLGGGIRFITGASRLESTCSAANVFVGMAEAPLTILPYLNRISRAQLFVLMSLGLSSVAGTVLVAYAALGIRIDLLLTAAFMAAPGGLLMGRLLVPETQEPFDVSGIKSVETDVDVNRAGSLIEAATDGALVGLKIMLNVFAVLIAFVAAIALLNGVLGGIGGLFGYPELSMELLLGYLFAPVSYLIGVPWEEATRAGVYLGQKVVLNEFLAYVNFSPDIATFSERGQIAITIALCGFANFTGLAILIAGLSSVVPERSSEISRLGLKAVLAGTLSNFMSAAIVGLLS